MQESEERPSALKDRGKKNRQTGGLVSCTRFEPESTHMQDKRHRLSQTAD